MTAPMPLRMLVAYGMESTFVQTTLDYLMALKRFTGCEVDFVHVTHGAEVLADFSGYDVVFHHYGARLCFEGIVPENYRERLRRFPGVKILSVQDEYNNTNATRAAIRDLGFDVLLTCVPPAGVEYVYPRAELPGVEIISVFAGYVSDDAAAPRPGPPLSERPIVLGYRGRMLGGLYGQLGFEKYEIGRRMKEICDARGIACDISSREEDRIYGEDWYTFIGNCRAMLGSESGSNVFDFDGSLAVKFEQMTRENHGVAPTYEEFRPYIGNRESEIEMGQISPRVFECALMRTPLVLMRGGYSGAIRPEEHFIPLEKDFSNAEAVLARLENLPALEAMVERAYQHLVASGKFGYRAFGATVRAVIDRHVAKKGWTAKPVAASAYEEARSAISKHRQNLLAEIPTPLPRTREDFHRKQLALAGITSASKLRRREAAYTTMLRQFERQISAHLAVAEALDNALHTHDPAARPVLDPECWASFADMLAYRRERIGLAQTAHEAKLSAARSGSDMNSREQERAMEQERYAWASEYPNVVTAFVGVCESALVWIKEQLRLRMAEGRQNLPYVVYADLLLQWLGARASGSKRELAKALIRRSARAERLGRAVTAYLRRLG